MPLRAGDVAAIPDTGGFVRPGKHVAQVTAAGEELRANDGALLWRVTFTTDQGDIRETIFWTERAMIRGRLLCEALGVDLSDPEAEISAGDLIGRVCEIEVEEEEFTGRDGKQHKGSKIGFRGFAAVSDEVAAKAAAPSTTAPAKAGVKRLFG